MSTYEPGTLAIATVRGIEGVRVFRQVDHRGEHRWEPATPVNGWLGHSDSDVTDVHRLAVLDLDGAPAGVGSEHNLLRFAASVLDNGRDGYQGEAAWLRGLADQIEAQAKPPRIPEPGLWGVVEARLSAGDTFARRFVRKYDRGNGGYDWHSLHIADPTLSLRWSDLIDPVLIREGVES